MPQEPNGWTRVEEAPKGWTLVEHAKSPTLADRVLDTMSNPVAGPLINAGSSVLRFAKDNPVAAGAMAGGALAAPFTAGTSMLPTLGMMATAGLGAAGGAGVGIAGRQLATGRPENASDTATTMGLEGAGAALLAGVPAATGAVMRAPLGAAAKVADMAGMVGVPGARPIGTALRVMQRLGGSAAAPSANAGGRLVKATGEPIENVMADVLQEARMPPKPTSVSLPPQAQLPRGYTPRTSAPAPVEAPPVAPSPNAGGRLTRPTTPAAVPPTANPERAIAEALTELQQPAQAAAPKPAPLRLAHQAPKPAPKPAELPASWQRLVETPKPAGALPTAEAPLSNAFDHTPIWSRGAGGGNPARDMRGLLGAEDAGTLMDMSADDVRALSGAAKRRPLVADLADMDRGYSRQLANPRGEMPTGLALGLGAGVPTAEVLRRALVAALSGGSPDGP